MFKLFSLRKAVEVVLNVHEEQQPTTLMALSEEEMQLTKCGECGGFYQIDGDCPTCKVEPFETNAGEDEKK